MRSLPSSAALLLCLVTAGCAADPADGSEEGTAEAITAETPSPAADIFASDGFTVVRNDASFRQRLKIVDGRIYCETTGRIHGSIDEALKLLQSEWTWYGGRVDDFRIGADGHRRYVLWPAGLLGFVHVTEDMSPPERLPNGGVRIRVDLEGFGSGLAYVELRPAGSGAFTITGRFAGVRSNILPTAFFANKHLEAEGGQLGFPAGPGGGFEGLKTALDAER